MFDFLIRLVLVPLILTIIIELGVWKSINLLLKEYSLKYIWLSIIAINIATNPAFNILSTLFDPTRNNIFIEIIFEAIIVFAEAILLYIIYNKTFNRFFLLSALMNLISYGIGLLLFKPIWL